MWEHEFDSNKLMKNTVEPPKIRDCFYGGRCEPVKLIYDFKKKNAHDVVSLYPTAKKDFEAQNLRPQLVWLRVS